MATQHPPVIMKSYNGFLLQYKSINNNHSREESDWNYKVNSHVDFSKLFLDHWDSKYTDFTKCPASAVLGIILHMRVFPDGFRTHIENYRNQVRNPLAHWDQAEWSNDKFGETLEMMKSLISLLDLPENEIQQNIKKLDEWRQKKLILTIVRQQPVSLNFRQGETTGSDHLEATVHGLNEAQEKKTTDKLTQTEPTECEALEILSASKGSIKLDLRADLDIFRTPESFKTAVHELLDRVIDASGIGPDEVDCLDVDFILPKTLTEEQLKVVASAFPGSFPEEKDTRNELHSMSETGDVIHSWIESEVCFMKCVSVLVEIFPKILRTIMKASMIPASSMHARIQSDDIFKQKLTANDNKALQTLIEDGYTKLDVSLIFKIIMNYTNLFISPPTKGWSSIPTSTQTEAGNDVQRLRLMRNSFLYNDPFEISEERFNKFFAEVTSICERIDKTLNCTDGESFKEMVESKRKQPLTDLPKLYGVYNDERLKEQPEVVSTGFPGLLPMTYSIYESHEMMETSDGINPLTKSHLRFLKCISVVFEVFPKILRKIMETSMISASMLYCKIERDICFKKQLTVDDHRTLGTLQTDGYTKLDMPIIFKIIKYYTSTFIGSPTRGLSSNPLPVETNVGGDVQRLKLSRNRFLHKVTAEVSQEEFEEFFANLNLVCERIDIYTNCRNAESFKMMVECYRRQPIVDLENTHRVYQEERSLKEYFVEQVGRTDRVSNLQSAILKDIRRPNNT